MTNNHIQENVPDERVPQFILLFVNKIKRIDMKISVDITGIANCQVRDANGNLLAAVWTRNSVCNEFENATLLTREALQKHLQNFIDAGVKENLEVLQKVKDPALLVDWVVRTAEYWEKRYAEKRNEKYDISQSVLSVMFEVVFDTVAVILHDSDFASVVQLMEKKMNGDLKTNKFHRHILRNFPSDVSDQEKDLETFFYIHRGHNALVRLLFRTDCVQGLRERLCILAGKLLQKKEVCNKAGMYCSHRQRSDIIQEWFYAQRDFKLWCEDQAHDIVQKLKQELNKETSLFLVIDHTAINLSLSMMVHTSPVPLHSPTSLPAMQPDFSAGDKTSHPSQYSDD